MVRAWFIDEDPKNPKEEHHRCPPKFVTLEELYKTTGVEYFQINPENYQVDAVLRGLMEEREMSGQQIVEDLDENDLRQHYVEHFHTYEEFRICLEGCGYFDIRDKFEEWIRIEVIPGDLIVIPGGCYHRFTVDNKKVYRGVRILKDNIYQAHVRPSDKLTCRKEYIRKLYNGAFEPHEEEKAEPTLIQS